MSDISDAIISNAELELADLGKSNLTGANLERSNFGSVNLQGALVTSKQLENASSIEGTVFPDGRIHLVRYKGIYRIRVNRVPELQFEFGTGFGWGFVVYERDTEETLFGLALKSFDGRRTSENIDKALDLGLGLVKELIDSGNYKQYNCFQWEPDGPRAIGVTEVDCDKISPGQFRSPL